MGAAVIITALCVLRRLLGCRNTTDTWPSSSGTAAPRAPCGKRQEVQVPTVELSPKCSVLCCKQVEITCMQLFTREMISASRNTQSILVTALCDEEYVLKNFFCNGESLKLSVLMKLLPLQQALSSVIPRYLRVRLR